MNATRPMRARTIAFPSWPQRYRRRCPQRCRRRCLQPWRRRHPQRRCRRRRSALRRLSGRRRRSRSHGHRRGCWAALMLRPARMPITRPWIDLTLISIRTPPACARRAGASPQTAGRRSPRGARIRGVLRRMLPPATHRRSTRLAAAARRRRRAASPSPRPLGAPRLRTPWQWPPCPPAVRGALSSPSVRMAPRSSWSQWSQRRRRRRATAPREARAGARCRGGRCGAGRRELAKPRTELRTEPCTERVRARATWRVARATPELRPRTQWRVDAPAGASGPSSGLVGAGRASLAPSPSAQLDVVKLYFFESPALRVSVHVYINQH